MEEVISLVWLCRTEVFIKNIVLNMVHDNMMKSVHAGWNSQEWAYNAIKEVLANLVVRLFEQLSMLSVVHHENKPLHPHEQFESKRGRSQPMRWIKEQKDRQWNYREKDV
jgi:hypothetical protein